MPYIPPDTLAKIKQIDLFSYLKTYAPSELVRISGNVYRMRSHESLKISNGKWMWWSRGIGGRSALDYLIKVEGYSFLEAAELIMSQASLQPPEILPAEKTKEKILLLPEPYRSCNYVVSYLKSRGIDSDLIRFCIRTGRLYESRNYHNAVFVGHDSNGKARYAALRGVRSAFIGEASGSDKNYSFCIPAEGNSARLHLFECAIDLLSYGTLLKIEGRNWRADHLLSLAGVYQPAKEIEKSKIPAALARFLKENPQIREVVFHLDNDKTGRLATTAIRTVLPEKYQCIDEPPKQGLDVNDELCMRLGIRVTKREKASSGRDQRGVR